jgi:hypothetical protein
MNKTGKPSEKDMEWENRVLCSDGNCIGTIGPDGRCRICGLANDIISGDASGFSLKMDKDDGYEGEKGSVIDPLRDSTLSGEDGEIAADPWENRVLCSDENCIGVMGPDGNCNECGKPGS